MPPEPEPVRFHLVAAGDQERERHPLAGQPAALTPILPVPARHEPSTTPRHAGGYHVWPGNHHPFPADERRFPGAAPALIIRR